jgi:2,4-dienoyl-CoA reductase-like NADH-dependent reductase (Old Yellow Enzyme family)
MVEASGVSPTGRITHFITAQGAVPGIQLAHAGRKASVDAPWRGGRALDESEGGWRPIYAPTAEAFSYHSPVPAEMTKSDIERVIGDFARAAKRALDSGFKIIELHGAHGYLLHEFLSPLSNKRTDEYGGSFKNRIRFTLETIDAVRAVWPDDLPLFIRLSATDWTEGGWDIAQSTELARMVREHGVDLVDASSGGNVAGAKIPLGPGYQVEFAEAIRRVADVPTGAVGLITDSHQADDIIRSGQADVVILARELLRDPYWPLRAARELGVKVKWPSQYERAEL